MSDDPENAKPTDADPEDVARGILWGTACRECGDDIEPGEPCQTCAEKRELLRQAFPKKYGDS